MAPTVPQNVQVTTTDDGYLQVSWTRNPIPEKVIYYLVYRGTKPIFPLVETSLIGPTIGTSVIDMDITDSTYYYYIVVAVDNDNNQGPPSTSVSGIGKLDKIVEDITVSCLVGITILLLFYVMYNGLIFDKYGYLMSFNGNPTFADDKISAIMNNSFTNRIVTVYGINSSTELSVHSSDLTNNDADVAIPLTASLAKMDEAAKMKSGNATRIMLTLKNSEIKAGSFDGLLTIHENEFHTIPIRLATEPMLIQSITVVGIGILVSIILWELIKYFRKNNAEQQRQLLLDKSRIALDNASRYQQGYDLLQVQLEPLNISFSTLQTQINDVNKRAQFAAVASKRNQLAKDAAVLKSMENMSRIAAETHSQRAAVNAQQVEKYRVRSSHRGTTYGKIILVELGSALFGITLALFGLLTNDYVIGLRSLGAFEITVLIGLGLGIGSLKEFVDN